MRCFHPINAASLLAALLGLTAASDGIPKRPVPATDRLPLREQTGATRARTKPDSATRVRVQTALDQLPLYFIENRGQMDQQVAYYVQGTTSSFYFTSEGLTFSFKRQDAGKRETQHSQRGPQPTSERYVVKLDFVGANPDVRPLGQERSSAAISYFKGPKEQWKTGLPTYTSVVYPDLWPGIDLVYSGTVNQLKSTFVVKPGADPNRIRLAYRGATEVRSMETGRLEVVTPAGSVEDDTPFSYQEIGDTRIEVPTAFAVEPLEGEGEYEYGFDVGVYDTSRPLVIDPVSFISLRYAGYIGGSYLSSSSPGGDSGEAIAVDLSGAAYVTGSTFSSSTTFPVAVGPDLTDNGSQDAFVAKVNAAGTALVYAGYIGGSDIDRGEGIAVDVDGNAYVAGWTYSTESTFPVAVGPDLTQNGDRDAFVVKVSSSGTALTYAGFIGGSADDLAQSIAVDSARRAYVVGQAFSSESSFPVTVGPDLTQNGSADIFVARISTNGSSLSYAGYIGGSNGEIGEDIALDSAGNAYVTGETLSDESSFPVTGGPDLTHNGGYDAFVAKVDPTGKSLNYAGYIGGTLSDFGRGIAVDSSGSAYVTGETTSNEYSFPVTVGPDLTLNGVNDFDAFVAKVNVSGSALSYAGYIGGNENDYGSDIAVDSAGNAYIVGTTSSTRATFPVTVGPDLSYNGNEDAFVASVNASGTALRYAGYIGGENADRGSGIAVDSVGAAYVTGATLSSESTFPVVVGPDLTFNTSDAFVAKISRFLFIGLSLNDDFFADVFLYNADSGTWFSESGNGRRGFITGSSGTWDRGWTVDAGHFNADGLTELLLYNPTTGTYVKVFSTPGGEFTYVRGDWSPGWRVHVVDLNADGVSDVFLHNPTTGLWSKCLTVAEVTDFSCQGGQWSLGWTVVPANLDRNGRTDFVLYNPTTGQLFWAITTDGDFVYRTEFLSPNWNLTPGDFNDDGLSDLHLYNAATGQYVIALNTGAGYSYMAGLWDPGWTIRPGDFNGDGRTDLFLYHVPTGRWVQAITTEAGTAYSYARGDWSASWEVYVTDFDTDGLSDVLLYNRTTGQWFQCLNAGVGAFAYGTGFWQPNLAVVVR